MPTQDETILRSKRKSIYLRLHDEWENVMDGKLRNMTGIYIRKGDRMLMLYRQGGRVVSEVWVPSAGGHFEEAEYCDARACVLRELNEELGITEEQLENLRLRYVTLRQRNGEIRQNYYFFADLKADAGETFSSNEGVCRWFALSELPSLEMPFTARFVMEHYLKTGYATLDIYGGIADGEKVVFTKMPEF